MNNCIECNNELRCLSDDVLMNLTEEEVNIIVGIEMAIQQKEQDEQAKELAKSNMANTMRKF